jgi:predicted nucleic acid-binding protein
MIETIVVNASPIISLGRMMIFNVLAKMPYEFICPAEVNEEISAGKLQGYPVSVPDFMKVGHATLPLSPISIATLDRGEAAVIHLALERGIETVCIDDLKGRRAATAVGLKVVGSLGLLGKAKKLGLIDEIRPFIELAKEAGIFYESRLIEHFLKELGE